MVVRMDGLVNRACTVGLGSRTARVEEEEGERRWGFHVKRKRTRRSRVGRINISRIDAS